MSSVPKNAKFIGGNDVNANLGDRSKMYGKNVGPWGINNCNMKGRRLLGFFSNNQLKVANSFYKNSSYVRWRSFNKTRSPHMLDVISVSEKFYKYVGNYGCTDTPNSTISMCEVAECNGVQILNVVQFIVESSTYLLNTVGCYGYW